MQRLDLGLYSYAKEFLGNGVRTPTTKEQLKRWAEHFRGLLGQPAPGLLPDITSAERGLRWALKERDQEGCHDSGDWEGSRTRWDTSRGHQGEHGDSCQHAIQPLQQDLGEGGGTSPVERGSHHQAAKKDLRDCSSYRGIMLLLTPGKILSRVLLEVVDPKLQDQKAGFRRNRSCAGRIASLRIIVEQSLEWDSHLYIDFMDWRGWGGGEALQQCRWRDNVGATETLWSPREDNLPHSVHLSGHELQNCPHRPAFWKFRGKDCSLARMPAFTIPLPPGH